MRRTFDSYRQQRLRCPLALETATIITEQPFQHGWMLRRDDTDQIYLLLDTGQWSVYPDTLVRQRPTRQ